MTGAVQSYNPGDKLQVRTGYSTQAAFCLQAAKLAIPPVCRFDFGIFTDAGGHEPTCPEQTLLRSTILPCRGMLQTVMVNPHGGVAWI